MDYMTGAYVKKWRKARDLSARELGEALGYRGREYVKKIESGYFPITRQFARRFEDYKNRTQAREYGRRKIETKYPLPRHIKILARPRRCAVCREWFIFPNAADRVCTSRTCRREYAQLERRTRKAGR